MHATLAQPQAKPLTKERIDWNIMESKLFILSQDCARYQGVGKLATTI